jgi:hypothetical protein
MVAFRNSGVNKKTRKVDSLTWEQERRILDHVDHQCNTPKGIQLRTALFCIMIFVIRGVKELYNTKQADFVIERDEENMLCVR